TRFSRDWSSDVCSSDLSEREARPDPTSLAQACSGCTRLRLLRSFEIVGPISQRGMEHTSPGGLPVCSISVGKQGFVRAVSWLSEIGRASCRGGPEHTEE